MLVGHFLRLKEISMFRLSSASLILILLLGQFKANAQEEMTFSVLEADGFAPIEGATLAFTTNEGIKEYKSPKGGELSLTFNRTPDLLVVSHSEYRDVEFRDFRSKNILFLHSSKVKLDEVVVTGQSRPQLARKSVKHIRVINEERIQNQAAVNLKELLSNDLNFRVSEDAILGSQINLQGLSGSKVKILIDGVPVIGRLDGNIDLGQINLNNIERVELVEGPMSVQYGTDAVAGTINLITKNSPSSAFQAQLNTYAESVGRYNFDATVDYSLDARNRLHLGFGRNYFDGFDPSEESRNLQWNPKEQYFMSLGYKHGYKNSLIRYRLNYFDEEIRSLGAVGGLDSVVVPQDTGAWKYPRALDDYYQTTRLDQSLFFDKRIGGSGNLKAFLAYNYFNRRKTSLIRNLSTGEELLFNGTDAQDTSIFTSWASRGSYSDQLFRKALDYQLGYDLNAERNSGERIEDGIQDILDLALFTSLVYKPVKSLSLQPGFRYAYNSRFQSPLISSFALRWQISDAWILRSSYGKGFRAPSLKELYFFFVDENHNVLGNPDLTAETSDNYQFGFDYHLDRESWGLNWDLKGFFNDIRNEIRLVAVVDPTDEDPRGLFRNQNIAQTQSTGFNSNLSLTYRAWELESGVALIGLRNNFSFSDAAESEAQNGFLFYSQYRFNLSYEWQETGLRPSLFINHTGRRQDITLDPNEQLQITTFESFSMVDFTIQKTFFKKQLNLSLGVKNLFDVQQIQADSRISGGAHSSGSTALPFSYGRTYLARLQWTID